MILKFKEFTLDKDCKIKYQLNGLQTLEFTLLDGETVNCEDVFQANNNEYIVKAIDNNIITCELNLNDFKNNIVIGKRKLTNVNLHEAIISFTDWTILNSQTKNKRSNVELEDCTNLNALFEIAKVFNCTFEFNCLEKTLKVIDEPRIIDLIVSKDINLVSLDVREDSYQFYTRLYCFGKDNITISDVNDGKDYVEDFSHSNRVISAIWRDERFTDKLNLKNKAIEVLKQNSKPIIEYDVKIMDLSDNPEYQKLRLHDEFTFFNYKTKRKEKHRIIELVQYSDNPHLNEITVVSKSKTFTEYMQSFEDDLKMKINQGIADEFQTRFDKTMESLNKRFEDMLSNGHKIEENGTIYFVDKLPKEHARNVLKIGVGGIMASSNGFGGPYEVAISNNGIINASKIMSGEMDGAYIKAGTLDFDKLSMEAKNKFKEGLVTKETFSKFQLDQNGLIQKMETEVNRKILENKTAVNNKIDNLQVGGRNLFLGTKDFSGTWHNGANKGWGTDPEKYKGFIVKKKSGLWEGLSQPIYAEKGEVYALSGFLKTDKDNDGVMWYLRHGSVKPWANSEVNYKAVPTSTEWKWVYVTFKITESGYMVPRFERYNDGELYVCGLKLEKGTIATDWSPAPEDINANLPKLVTSEITNRKSEFIPTYAWANSPDGVKDFTAVAPNTKAPLICKAKPNFVVKNDSESEIMQVHNMWQVIKLKPNTQYTLSAKGHSSNYTPNGNIYSEGCIDVIMGNNALSQIYFTNTTPTIKYYQFTTPSNITGDIIIRGGARDESLNWSGINLEWYALSEGNTRYTDYPTNEPAQYQKYRYIGVGVTSDKQNPSEYTWTDISTNQAHRYYTHIRYSSNADGSNFSTIPNDYMGVAVTADKKAPLDKEKYTWSKIKGADGEKGKDALNLLVYADLDKPLTELYGTDPYIRASARINKLEIKDETLIIDSGELGNLLWSLKSTNGVTSNSEYDDTHLRFIFKAKSDKPTIFRAVLGGQAPITNQQIALKTKYQWYDLIINTGKSGMENYLKIIIDSPVKVYLKDCKVIHAPENVVLEENIKKIKVFESDIKGLKSVVGESKEKIGTIENSIVETKSLIQQTKNEIKLSVSETEKRLSTLKPRPDISDPEISQITANDQFHRVSEDLEALQYYTMVFDASFIDSTVEPYIYYSINPMKSKVKEKNNIRVFQYAADKVPKNRKVNLYPVGNSTISNVRIYKGDWAWFFKKDEFITETEAKTAIKIAKSEILSTVVTPNNLGSHITQNAEYIKIAWNQISQMIQFEPSGSTASIAIYDGTNSYSNLRSRINEDGFHFYRNSQYIGKIGTNTIKGDSSKKGLVFDIEADTAYMTWAAKDHSSSDSYSTKWTYVKRAFGGFNSSDTLYASCDIDVQRNQLKKAILKGDCSVYPEAISGGITHTYRFASVQHVNDDGTAQTWSNNCHLTFKNGILISSKLPG